MACLFCQSEQMRPEFWLTEPVWDSEVNPYYVRVTGEQCFEFGFRTRIYPPDIIARWIKDGGLCMTNKFIPWRDVIRVSWEPSLEKRFLDEIEEEKA